MYVGTLYPGVVDTGDTYPGVVYIGEMYEGLSYVLDTGTVGAIYPETVGDV